MQPNPVPELQHAVQYNTVQYSPLLIVGRTITTRRPIIPTDTKPTISPMKHGSKNRERNDQHDQYRDHETDDSPLVVPSLLVVMRRGRFIAFSRHDGISAFELSAGWDAEVVGGWRKLGARCRLEVVSLKPECGRRFSGETHVRKRVGVVGGCFGGLRLGRASELTIHDFDVFL
jgi:hypothetical protein